MGHFHPASFTPPLPYDPPSHLSVPDFLFGAGGKFGRYPLANSKPPFICGITGKAYSASQVAERIELLSRALAADLKWQVNTGCELEKVIGIFSINAIDTMTVSWATHRLSGTCSLINAFYSAPELTQQLRFAECKALFTCLSLLDVALESAQAANIPTKNIYLIDVPQKAGQASETSAVFKTVDDLIREGKEMLPLAPLEWHDDQGARKTAFLCASSGTSGQPKNAKISHLNVIAMMMQFTTFERPYRSHEPEMCLGVLPFSHNYALIAIAHMGVYRGDGIIVMPGFDLIDTLRVIHDYRLARLWLVPPMLTAMIKSPALVRKYDLASVNTTVVGGSNLTPEVSSKYLELVPTTKLIQGYGLTETTVGIAFQTPQDMMPGACGNLFPGCLARLIDNEGRDIEEYNRPGELLVKSLNVMLGYLKNDTESRQMLSGDGWLRTGDMMLFKQSAAGHAHLFLVDRIKELIKVRNMQVSPAELENFLLRHPYVAEAAVVPVPSESAGELPMAFIVRQPEAKDMGEDSLREQLHQHIREAFAQHKHLAGGIQFLENFPKTAAGKNKRGILKQWAKAACEAEKDTVQGVQVIQFDSDDDDSDEA